MKNLASHDNGRTFEVIMKVLREELGYWVPEPQVIDAQGFVPQHRERIFIVGFRKKVDFSWDQVAVGSADLRMSDILHPENGSEEAEDPYTLGEKAKLTRNTLSATSCGNTCRTMLPSTKRRGTGSDTAWWGRRTLPGLCPLDTTRTAPRYSFGRKAGTRDA